MTLASTVHNSSPRLYCGILGYTVAYWGRASLNSHKSTSLHLFNTSLTLSLGTGFPKSQGFALVLRLLFIIPTRIISSWFISTYLSGLIFRLWRQGSSCSSDPLIECTWKRRGLFRGSEPFGLFYFSIKCWLYGGAKL